MADEDTTRATELAERLAEHVDAMLAGATREEAGAPLIRAKELADRLGMSESLIYRLARRGEIPCYKFGAAWRFDEEEVKTAMRRSAQNRDGDH